MDLGSIKDWFFSLGTQYHVNPLIFGLIYVGAIPFFTASIAWLVRNYRRSRSILLPLFSAGFWFVSAYLYLIIAGRNVPSWVYGVVVVLIVVGAISTIRRVRKQIRAQSMSPNGQGQVGTTSCRARRSIAHRAISAGSV